MESYQIAELLTTLIVSISLLGAMGIAAKVWLTRKAQALPGGREIVDAIEGLRDSIEGMRAEVAELAERVEFTERVLARLADEQRQLPNA
jgi:hypothetical protein